MTVVCGYAQDAKPLDTRSQPIIASNSSEDELIVQEKILAELKALRLTTRALQEQLELVQKTLEIYKQIDVSREKQVQYLQKALEDQERFGALSERKEQFFNQQLNVKDKYIESQQKEITALKKSKFLDKLTQGASVLALIFLAVK